MTIQLSISLRWLTLFAVALPLLAACSDSEKPRKLADKAHEKTADPSTAQGHHGKATENEEHEIHWSYSGEGAPEKWGLLKEEFATCGKGASQSPIDITGVNVSSQPDLKPAYAAAPLKVINNGHTLQVNYAKGSMLEIDGKTYELLQFHFHSPSEHTIGGKAHDMVAHLVHKSAAGELAVIGVMIDAGKSNKLVEKVWKSAPGEAGKEMEVSDEKINASELLPRDLSYFSYSGSLTTPPCTEGVRWLVLTAPVQASQSQIDAFRKLFPLSARPVQPQNGRVVLLSN